ncbi:cysteine-rich motor neuron 1 protein-like [Episyrphus balteatus]|uniref:cysteine-rich motor neuron 1 protein-like n=1 Tax=Episyrphus balteatus TaxID=286459 RepID=UPI0024851959|nr:cysteine-rich motor neuron 1 protein-like [Episyrphus balteatus]
MNCRMKLIIAVFLILNSSATINSDHIEVDCIEVQCPLPELECPPDSELKSSSSNNFENNAEEDGDSNLFDQLEADGMIEELFSSSMLPTTTQLPHILQKRSLQHRRREAIKIVPGDYRSFEPEFFKYHNHHQPHRKWKRDLIMGAQPHSEAEIKKCCPEFQCVCQTCPNAPKCEKEHVAIIVEEGHRLPGSCCPKYECVPEMECSAVSQPKTSYWRNECLKCDCYGGHELCQQLCEVDEDQSAMNCFSGYLNRPKMNGDIWLEDDDCKECKCVNGDNKCQMSVCKAADCENPVKVEGKCCKVCPEISTTLAPSLSTSTTSTQSPVTTSTLSPEDEDTTQEVPLTTSTTQSSVETSTPSTTTSIPVTEVIPTTLEIDNSSITNTEVKTSPQDMSHLLEEIDIIVVLILASAILVIFTIGMGLVVSQRQKKKKLMYSTIPSSDSSQSSSITLA